MAMNAHAKLGIGQNEILAWCIDYIAKTLDMPPAGIHSDSEVDEFGLDSVMTTTMVMDLESWLGVEIPLTILFEQRTLKDVAASVARRLN
jgi:acyl carrier protein